MRSIRYCARCVMPETKPDLFIDGDGVCSACRNYERRGAVDWDRRRQELQAILERYRAKNGENYDCVVPVSGGKDSHFQTIRLLELGMNPLAVTATTDHLSAIGRRNIENLKRQGVDYIEVTTNPVVRRKINRLALTPLRRTALMLGQLAGIVLTWFVIAIWPNHIARSATSRLLGLWDRSRVQGHG